MRPDLTWPCYFARKPLKALRVTYKEGDQFIIQEKSYIRGLASAYGVNPGWASTCDFAKLPYVAILNVRSEEMARQVREQGMTYKQAERLVGTAEAA